MAVSINPVLGLVDGRLELHNWPLERLTVVDVLVEDTENLVVEQFIHTNSLHHLLE